MTTFTMIVGIILLIIGIVTLKALECEDGVFLAILCIVTGLILIIFMTIDLNTAHIMNEANVRLFMDKKVEVVVKTNNEILTTEYALKDSSLSNTFKYLNNNK